MENVDSRGPMVTSARELELFGQILALLGTIGADLGHIVIAGDLNPAQLNFVYLALVKVNGLEDLFRAERARQAAMCAPSAMKES